MKKLILFTFLLFTLTSCGPQEDVLTCKDTEIIDNGICVPKINQCDGIVIDDDCQQLDVDKIAFYQATENTKNEEFYQLDITLTSSTEQVSITSYYEENHMIHTVGEDITHYEIKDGICYINEELSLYDSCETGNEFLFYRYIYPDYVTFTGDNYIFSQQYKDQINNEIQSILGYDSFEVFVITLEEGHISNIQITFVYGTERIQCNIDFTYYLQSQLEGEGH